MFNPLVNFLTLAHCEVCSERLCGSLHTCCRLLHTDKHSKKRIYLQHFWSRWATFDPFLFLLRTCPMSQTCKAFPRLFHSGKHAILKPVSQLISGFIFHSDCFQCACIDVWWSYPDMRAMTVFCYRTLEITHQFQVPGGGACLDLLRIYSPCIPTRWKFAQC